ncbi:ABC transporter transmembrane domain-containing protein, partial [Corynebacterium striatum]
MSNATTPASSRLRDPLLTRSVKKLQGPVGHKLNKRYACLSLIVGVLDGLAVLTLVPLTKALDGDTTIAPWMWTLLAIALVAFALRFFATMASYHTALDFIRTAHTTVGDKLATLPLGWFVPANTGGLSRLVSDRFMVAAETIAHVQGTIYRDSAALVTLLVGACFWNPKLGLVLLIIAPLALVVMQLAAWIREKASNRTLGPSKELSQRIVEFANRQPALRAAGQSQVFAPLEQALEIDHKARIRELWVSTLALLLNGIVVQFFIVALIMVSADLAVEGALSPLETIAIIGISLRFTRTLEQLGSSFVGLDAGRIALAETELITDAPSLPEPTTPRPGDGSGNVELRNVTFGYGDKPVLVDVAFHARSGTVTAIVGPSGSGKTTIARLISRFWDVDSGAVMVDGVDIREL